MPNDVKTYDLIIIGAGSGNMIPVPEMDGWNLAIVEPDKFGGTCLNRGGIPSKMLLYPAEIVEMTQHGAKLGVHHTLDRIDWQRIVGRVRQKIDPIAEAGAVYRKSQPHITVYDQPAHNELLLTALCWEQVPDQPFRTCLAWTGFPITPLTRLCVWRHNPHLFSSLGAAILVRRIRKTNAIFTPRAGVDQPLVSAGMPRSARQRKPPEEAARGSCWALLGARRWETGSHVSDTNAHPVADSIRAAEADGFNQVGLGHLPQYCDDARSGRVDGHASPTWDQTAEAAIFVNAHHGFSHAPLPLPTNLWSS